MDSGKNGLLLLPEITFCLYPLGCWSALNGRGTNKMDAGLNADAEMQWCPAPTHTEMLGKRL